MARAAARRRDPLGLRDDRARRRVVGRDQHPDAASRATATSTSSTAASGGPPARGDPRCSDLHRHGQDRPRRAASTRQQSMILVPARRAGRHGRAAAHRVRLRRRAARPHARSCSRTCACRLSNILLGEGRGFEIAQGRLGPGRIHHCMRSIGAGRARARADVQAARDARRLRQAARRAVRVARAHRRGAHRMIDQARLLTLKAALDDGHRRQQGRAQAEIAMIKVRRAERRLQGDRLGDPGARRRRRVATTSRWPTPTRSARTLRLADGPDEVHRNAIAKVELYKYKTA